MSPPDDQRTVTVTIAQLKAFEAAVRERYSLLAVKMRADDAVTAAKEAYDRALDAELAATKALHGAKP